ncbi:NDR1/HIN1-like protein 10 [Durio zibethinus]|uniref:NDR1/HIN1-like protein 10 n=1 Tax=Durio zibethinus TaxID=66656 RepID=A0A6P6AMF7_DURZI|nr:NDR1/HIN1-like protein 10 [Durio zibethinus]
MASQSDDHQNQRDQSDYHSSPSSDTYNNHQSTPPAPPQPPSQPPNNHQSPAQGYLPAMGYPPHMMYPNAPYPGGCPPPPHGYNQYPYAQHQAAPYYNQGYASGPHDPCSGFVRGIVAAVILLILLSCISSLITWAILRPQVPVFQVDNMSVSNFSTSSNPFTATWDTNLTVENPNHKLRLYFDKIVGAIFYNEEDSLGSSWLNPAFMQTQTNTTIHAVISANGSAQNAVPIWVAQEMGKDRATGSVTFALRFRVWATFKSGSWWTRSLVLKVLCDDLKVNFVGVSGNGALAPEKRDDCEVYA